MCSFVLWPMWWSSASECGRPSRPPSSLRVDRPAGPGPPLGLPGALLLLGRRRLGRLRRLADGRVAGRLDRLLDLLLCRADARSGRLGGRRQVGLGLLLPLGLAL